MSIDRNQVFTVQLLTTIFGSIVFSKSVNDPHTMHVMSKCATELVMWDIWMKSMTDFNKVSRVMTRMMNPTFYQPMTSGPELFC